MSEREASWERLGLLGRVLCRMGVHVQEHRLRTDGRGGLVAACVQCGDWASPARSRRVWAEMEASGHE